MLYTCQFTLIFVIWDSFVHFLCACDMACGACDRENQITIVDRHLSEGVRDTLWLGEDSF